MAISSPILKQSGHTCGGPRVDEDGPLDSSIWTSGSKDMAFRAGELGNSEVATMAVAVPLLLELRLIDWH